MERELTPVEARSGVVSGRIVTVLAVSFVGAVVALAAGLDVPLPAIDARARVGLRPRPMKAGAVPAQALNGGKDQCSSLYSGWRRMNAATKLQAGTILKPR